MQEVLRKQLTSHVGLNGRRNVLHQQAEGCPTARKLGTFSCAGDVRCKHHNVTNTTM